MNLGNVARVVTVAAACFAAVGSATSNTGSQQQQPQPQSTQSSPPPPQDMEANRALGLWRSTFGAVKIDADNAHGGLQSGALHGVWQYQRQGQDVVGYFYGTLRGNVLQFHWQEPANPPLTGEGYIVFEQTGRQYSGRWWSDRKDRVGDWNGWRQQGQTNPNPQYPQPYQGQYGGQGYGGYPPAPAGQQPYPPQPQQYPPQPQQYPPQQYPPQQYPPQQYPPQQGPRQQQPPQRYPQQQPYPPQQPQQQPQQQPPPNYY